MVKNNCVLVCPLLEEFSKFPDGGLEGYVAHKDFGSCLFLPDLLLLAWHLSFPVQRRGTPTFQSTFFKIKKPLGLSVMFPSASQDTQTFQIKNCFLPMNSCNLRDRTLYCKCISWKAFYNFVCCDVHLTWLLALKSSTVTGDHPHYNSGLRGVTKTDINQKEARKYTEIFNKGIKMNL